MPSRPLNLSKLSVILVRIETLVTELFISFHFSKQTALLSFLHSSMKTCFMDA